MSEGNYGRVEQIYIEDEEKKAEKHFKAVMEKVEKIRADKKLDNLEMAKICKRLGKYYESAPRV